MLALILFACLVIGTVWYFVHKAYRKEKDIILTAFFGMLVTIVSLGGWGVVFLVMWLTLDMNMPTITATHTTSTIQLLTVSLRGDPAFHKAACLFKEDNAIGYLPVGTTDYKVVEVSSAQANLVEEPRSNCVLIERDPSAVSYAPGYEWMTWVIPPFSKESSSYVFHIPPGMKPATFPLPVGQNEE